MKNLDLIASKVYQEINEKSIVVYYSVDLNDIAPFMCSPFNEGWFWSVKTKDIFNYIFEIIIANYLINDVMAFGDFNNIDNKDFDFLESVEVYKKYKNINKIRMQAIKNLEYLYNENLNKELSYFELVKLLVNIENCAPKVGINLIFESFSTPFEARHSKNLNVETFDYINFKNNF